MRTDAPGTMPTRRIAQLLLSAVLLACVVAVPSQANGGGSSIAHSAKKCKKHARSAVAAKRKCRKKRRGVIPPYQPVVTPPAPAPASLSISPTDHNFGTVPPGDSGNQTFTITNSGGSTSGTLISSLGGANPDNYVISSDTCNGIALAGGSSCTLDVRCHTVDANNSVLTATLTVAGYPGGYPYASLTCVETT